jgi:hypothetical protein
MFRKFALAGAMLLALSVPSLAACPASQLGNVSGQNAIALQTVEEAECAHLQTLATGTPTAASAPSRLIRRRPGTTNAVYPLATENHLGEVGNNEITLTSAITSTAVTYTDGPVHRRPPHDRERGASVEHCGSSGNERPDPEGGSRLICNEYRASRCGLL